MGGPFDLSKEFTVTCVNCGRECGFPTPLFLNLMFPKKLKTLYFCKRRCFSLFVKVMIAGWKDSERGE